jgi:hypothetical protein
MPSVTMKLRRPIKEQMKGVFGKYEFDVGIIEDKAHRAPAKSKKTPFGMDLKSSKSYAGGPVRPTSNQPDGWTISGLSKKLRNALGINFYSDPFKGKKQNQDIMKFSKSFFDLCQGRTQKKRCENLLQAIVRNPILRGDYGHNSPMTRAIKGFDRFLIDTGQFFKAIKARTITNRVSK